MSNEQTTEKPKPENDPNPRDFANITALTDAVMQHAPELVIVEAAGYAGNGFYAHDSEYPEHGSVFLGDDPETIASIASELAKRLASAQAELEEKS